MGEVVKAWASTEVLGSNPTGLHCGVLVVEIYILIYILPLTLAEFRRPSNFLLKLAWSARFGGPAIFLIQNPFMG
jgi:hypothetical protein